MNTIKDLKTSTTLSPVPPAERRVPDLWKTAPLSLEAAARVKCSMADLGVAGHDDLVVTILGLAIAYTKDHGLDLQGICRFVCPVVFVALADCGAPRSPSGPWDPTAFVRLLSAEELGRQAELVHTLLCIEAVDMEFAPDMWLMAAIWVLVALHVLEFGIERATMKLAERLLVFTPSDGWSPLCGFLGRPALASEFPRSNAREEFWALFGGEPVTA